MNEIQEQDAGSAGSKMRKMGNGLEGYRFIDQSCTYRMNYVDDLKEALSLTYLGPEHFLWENHIKPRKSSENSKLLEKLAVSCRYKDDQATPASHVTFLPASPDQSQLKEAMYRNTSHLFLPHVQTGHLLPPS